MRVQKISVVTPSYNQCEYLPNNLQSIDNQNHDNIEHLILDGGSDDGTIQIIDDYETSADHDVWWRSNSDDGQSAAINEGFERASGDIVGWLNSDDVYFDTTTLSRVVRWFEQTSADVIYGDLAYIDSRSRVTEVDVRPDFDRKKLTYRIIIGQPATFFRKEVVSAEKLDEDLDYCMDYEFWIRLSQKYDIRHVRDILAGFRQHKAQKTDNISPVNAEVSQMLDKYRNELPESQRILLDNTWTETRRVIESGRDTVSLHRTMPDLAFDGELAPLYEMMTNLGPKISDIKKALRRWQR